MKRCHSGAVLPFLLLVPFCGVAIPPESRGQSLPHTSAGTEFWIVFQKNFMDWERDSDGRDMVATQSLSHALYITTTSAATVVVEWGEQTDEYKIPAAATRLIQIDSSMQVTSSEEVSPRSVHVTSDQPITVTARSTRWQTTETYTIFPVESLGRRYRAVGYKWLSKELLSQFAIVAAEDSTVVEIVPSDVTEKERPPHEVITLLLNRGEVYQVRPQFRPVRHSDLTGSLITASRPVALFSGHNCAYVPDQVYKACNILVEQLTPVESWGRRFAIVRPALRGAHSIRIIPDEAETEVRINGEKVVKITDPWLELVSSDSLMVIEADRPVQVVQYAHGYTAPNRNAPYGDSIGDPMMILIQPVEQYGTGYVAVAPYSEGFRNFISIVTSEKGTAGVSIGGSAVDPKVFRRAGLPDIWYATLEVLGGTHRIDLRYPAGVSCYGFGVGGHIYDAYGQTAPMLGKPPTGEVIVEQESEEEGREGGSEITTEKPAPEQTWRPVENIE